MDTPVRDIKYNKQIIECFPSVRTEKFPLFHQSMGCLNRVPGPLVDPLTDQEFKLVGGLVQKSPNTKKCSVHVWGGMMKSADRVEEILLNKPIQDGGYGDAPLWPNRLSGTK